MKSQISALLVFAFAMSSLLAETSPHQACGIKTGEVTTDSAIIWTRLTKNAAANASDGPWFDIHFEKSGWHRADEKKNKREAVTGVRFEKPAKDERDIAWAVPGIAGETRVKYRRSGGQDWEFSDWKAVEAEWDFTVQHTLRDLTPGSKYEVVVESRGVDQKSGAEVSGGFKTAPAANQSETPIEFAVSTGQIFRDRNSDDGFVIYDTLLKKHKNLSFFVHTGDIVYYDRLAKTPGLANFHWQRTYSFPTNVRFHNQVASYFIKDDHDAWTNDSWPTMNNPNMGTFTFAQGLDIFVHQVPMNGRKTYRTQRWGKDLQVWMVEGRDFRSANTDPDGPEKTIWGAEQLAWFKKSFAESDATFRVLISPTPIVGPDRDKGKNDNHSNKVFTHEGDQVREFLASQKDAYVVCGDRHWQYHSIHPTVGIHEFCCGPASDAHAGGWNQKDYREDFHQFLRVKGGYLTVKTERLKSQPSISFRHHSETGDIKYEQQFNSTTRKP